MKVIFVVGLPGSGKTHLAKELAKNGYELFDDVGTETAKEDVINCLKDGKDCIIVDPHFCSIGAREAAQKIAEKFSADINWIFFENNPEACLKNIMLRDDGRKVENFIKSLSKVYSIPEKEKAIPVYKGSFNA